MHRFFARTEACAAAEFALDGREAHHALHVLRIRPGERVAVLDGAGQQLSCEVLRCGPREVRLRVVERRRASPPACHITLLQAVPKGKIIESIIQKATELGVRRIVPVLSERTTLQLDADEAAHKAGKWGQVAIEAVKQCGSPWLPAVEKPVSPAQFLAGGETFELPLVASLQPGSRHARQYFQSFRSRHDRMPRSACVWIGPEGDLTAAEVQAICDSGALPISLGPLVLRCETAAAYCLSILNYELQSDQSAAAPPA